MEGNQFSFLTELVVPPKSGVPMTPEQKFKWLAEKTRHQEYAPDNATRCEQVREMNQRKK